MEHYAYLFSTFGPSMHVWTLRFESKHQYFKRIVRYSQNFVNLTLMLSRKQQLLQAYLKEAKKELSEIEYENIATINTNTYSIKQAIRECHQMPSVMKATDSVNIKKNYIQNRNYSIVQH